MTNATEYVPIPGWESHYEANRNGEVRSKTRNSGGKVYQGKKLKPEKGPYPRFTFSAPGRREVWYLSRIIEAITNDGN